MNAATRGAIHTCRNIHNINPFRKVMYSLCRIIPAASGLSDGTVFSRNMQHFYLKHDVGSFYIIIIIIIKYICKALDRSATKALSICLKSLVNECW